jgi:hypothetical protein
MWTCGLIPFTPTLQSSEKDVDLSAHTDSQKPTGSPTSGFRHNSLRMSLWLRTMLGLGTFVGGSVGYRRDAVLAAPALTQLVGFR